MLIEAKANIQARNNATGCVPLHDAARQGHLGAVKALLAHGAPHMPRTNSGELPVDFAREGAHTECANFLEHYRAPDATAFKYQWYHGTLDRAEATAILRQHARRLLFESRTNNNNNNAMPEVGGTVERNKQQTTDNGNDDGNATASAAEEHSSGVFLVRFSAKTGDFVLTLLFENQPKNFIIQKYVSFVSCIKIDLHNNSGTFDLVSSVEMPVHRRRTVHAHPRTPHPALSALQRRFAHQSASRRPTKT